MKIRSIPALLLLMLLIFTVSITALSGCKATKKDDTDSDDEPGKDFSGSLNENPNNNTTPETPVDLGDPTKTYYIETADQFKDIKPKGTYILTADIDMTGIDWTPVGTYEHPFEGKFDGGGYTVTGLKVSKVNEDIGICISYLYSYSGLFGYAKNADISNLKLKDVDITLNATKEYHVAYAGAIVGMADCTSISDCEIISGSVTGSSALFKSYSAGICAFSFESTISDCTVNANISVTNSAQYSGVGGITAHSGAKTIISDCSVSGALTSISDDGNVYSGGIVGYLNNSDITRSFSTASVTAQTTCNDSETGKAGGAYAGGIVAYATNDGDKRCNITLVYSSGAVKADSADYASYAGGIAAYVSYSNVKHSYSVSSVSATSLVSKTYAGGISSYTSLHTVFEGVFFAGSLSTETLNNVARAGVITGYNSTESGDSAAKFLNTAYLTLTGSRVSINRIGYGGSSFDYDSFLVKGKEYGAAALKTTDVLVDVLGWNESEWDISDASFPTLKVS